MPSDEQAPKHTFADLIDLYFAMRKAKDANDRVKLFKRYRDSPISTCDPFSRMCEDVEIKLNEAWAKIHFTPVRHGGVILYFDRVSLRPEFAGLALSSDYTVPE